MNDDDLKRACLFILCYKRGLPDLIFSTSTSEQALGSVASSAIHYVEHGAVMSRPERLRSLRATSRGYNGNSTLFLSREVAPFRYRSFFIFSKVFEVFLEHTH